MQVSVYQDPQNNLYNNICERSKCTLDLFPVTIIKLLRTISQFWLTETYLHKKTSQDAMKELCLFLSFTFIQYDIGVSEITRYKHNQALW